MSDYLELTFDIFDDVSQRASVLNTLTIAELIAEIVTEFEELDTAGYQVYDLYMEGDNRRLESARTLLDLGLQPGDRLQLAWARDPFRVQRQPVSDSGGALLREAATNVEFLIKWQPAVIGRPDSNRAHNSMLAANLEWLPKSHRVSRTHAQITERGGSYYLEAMAENNPTYLNDETINPGRRYKLASGDTILLGRSGIQLDFELRE